MKRWAIAAALLLPALMAAAQVQPPSRRSRHNLSATGPGPVRSPVVDEVCVFCHTPHSSFAATPLWNQEASAVTYTPYSSSTMVAPVGTPTGSSKLCLSCHDGTMAVGKTLKGQVPMGGGPRALTGENVLGTNLSDDHPVSFEPILGPEIVNPRPGDPVSLDGDGRVQCTSCHDPHREDVDPVTGKFLVKPNSASALCLTCHQKAYWTTNPSSHRTSTNPYTESEGAHTGYTTVDTNACESCHKPHTAQAAPRVLKGVEEATCGTGAGSQCHGSSGVARHNIAAEFSKLYAHPTYTISPSSHDAAESPTNAGATLPEISGAAPRHAECADCHNPHASYDAATSAPKASGQLAGVWGIDTNGSVVAPVGVPPSVNEYEICYKCHGDSANKPQINGAPWGPYPNRQVPQFNMRLMFDPANPSYHPVEARGRNDSVPSLIGGWTENSLVYCSDCHGNDTGPQAFSPGGGPAGTHGSSFKHLLVARYDMDSGTVIESASGAEYALCYKCHDRDSISRDESFGEHERHVRGENAPCSICHDPHGVAPPGNPFNNSNLINFDRRFVTPSSSGLLRFEDLGYRQGRCYLICHGANHDPLSY